MNYAMRYFPLPGSLTFLSLELKLQLQLAEKPQATSRIFCAISRLCGLAQKATCSRQTANLFRYLTVYPLGQQPTQTLVCG